MALQTDLNLTIKDISRITSPDAVAAFLSSLGYNTENRKPLTPEAIGLAGDSAAAIRSLEVMAVDSEGFLRVVFGQLRSLTAKTRNDLSRVLGRTNVDHLLILTTDFETIEFVLLDKRPRESRGPVDSQRIQVVPLSITLARKSAGARELRAIRQLTWTGRDGLEQFDKLRQTFVAAAFAEDYFFNRALFADHFLLTRLREDPAWRDNPAPAFLRVKELLQNARQRWHEKGESIVRQELYEPLFGLLGFKVKESKRPSEARTLPNYILTGPDGKTAAFVYAWERWLDGPDFRLDQDMPEENPGACVVTALEEGVADWIIVTNGRQWRLYSRRAHSRATNFYEVDLVEALIASGDTDPNEAFRYWWLFFRASAFGLRGAGVPTARAAAETAAPQRCWLDSIAEGSREYAKQLGERLKERIFVTIFPHLAQGFLEDRKRRMALTRQPTEEELDELFEATLTLLYRLLFLLYAESRDLLPIREAAYRQASLMKIKEEISEKAGIAESESADRLAKRFSATETVIYDRLSRLCGAMDHGEPALNVPVYNGGLFVTTISPLPPGEGEGREHRIARFLAQHKVPDRYLAIAIDRLARDPDDKTFALVFIDYKSLEVRHLGSVYEGLLEFKLKVAEEDLTTKSEGQREKYIPLSVAMTKRGRPAAVLVDKGHVYLSNDKAERKASGSYYTPDPIVEYIVEHTVGPVLAEKLEHLRPEFRKVRKTFDRQLAAARDPRIHQVLPSRSGNGEGSEAGLGRDVRQEAADKTYDAHLELVEELFDFRTLDPAMGSGHFLVQTVDFITDRLLTFLNQFPVNPVTFMLDRTRRNILDALDDQDVKVDSDKLTEVNLLKRHVLKRCIYGVDLNPMAVELAKVSLWLDAFTIGAPLSFLDHHLRCGNSLIGATFRDLEAATKGELFGIDYEPLLRAIHHVIRVNKMADATAAEVKQSAGEYSAARRDLSGYQVVLDLLVAKYFGMPDAPEVLRMGADLDLSNRKKFAASVAALGVGDVKMRELRNMKELSPTLVADVEALASRPDLQFFHWEIEFPEVFYGFEDRQQRHIRHKNEISNGLAGFDAVVGNPPYVRMELIKPLKPFLKVKYRCHAERADLFIYFYERAIRLCKSGARFAFIASSNWTKTTAGAGLRQHLAKDTTLVSYLDFSEASVFADASTYPCVLVIAQTLPTLDHRVRTAAFLAPVPNEISWEHSYRSGDVPQSSLHDNPWVFERDDLAELRAKLSLRGKPFRDVCGAPLYGIKTGLNEAFVIDGATHDALVSADPRNADLLQPFLEGKDVKPWNTTPRSIWLINTYRGVVLDDYPAIRDHLSHFRAKLEARATSQKWYELQQAQRRYQDCFARPKLVFPRFVDRPTFAIDRDGFYINNALSAVPAADPVILFALMSPITWFVLASTGAPMANGYRQIHGHVLEAVPLPQFTADVQYQIVNYLRRPLPDRWEKTAPWELVFDAFELSPGEASLIMEAYGKWK
jgi:hypothetical protein